MKENFKNQQMSTRNKCEHEHSKNEDDGHQ